MTLYATGSLSVHSGQLHACSLSTKHTLYISHRPAFHPSFMMPYPKPTTYPATPCNCFLRSRCFLAPLSYPHPFTTIPSLSSKRNKAPSLFRVSRLVVKWRRPTLPRVCSTIGAVGLNFSVRNGKRWNPVAITTGNIS